MIRVSASPVRQRGLAYLTRPDQNHRGLPPQGGLNGLERAARYHHCEIMGCLQKMQGGRQ
jgi:hypothetical protein